ncbi:hypothetical protein CMMCAS03_03405 [Clavibacter michiganensis subsp. michiganensis]|nr:hypothetical protein CMMCAS03_03405 [Clavibacter michiganensis subsp. michiganensis]
MHPDEVRDPQVARGGAPAEHGEPGAAVRRAHGVRAGHAVEVGELGRGGRGHEVREADADQRDEGACPDPERQRRVGQPQAQHGQAREEGAQVQHGDGGRHDAPEGGRQRGRDVEVARRPGRRRAHDDRLLDDQRHRDHGPHDVRLPSEAREPCDEPRPRDGVDEDRQRELGGLVPDGRARDHAVVDQAAHEARRRDDGHERGDRHEGPVPPERAADHDAASVGIAMVACAIRRSPAASSSPSTVPTTMSSAIAVRSGRALTPARSAWACTPAASA